MADLNWIESMGTPTADSLIVAKASPAIILRKKEGIWLTSDLSGIDLKTYEYELIDDLEKKLNVPPVYLSEDVCFFSTSEERDNVQYCLKYLVNSEKIRLCDYHKDRIYAYQYQIDGIAQILPSILEPFPTEITFNISIDSLSEIFTCSTAIYKKTGNEYKLIGNFGPHSFNQMTFKVDNLYPGEQRIINKYLIAKFNDEADTQFIIVLYRDDSFSNEEISLIRTFFSLLQKSRELRGEQIKNRQTEKILDQFSYVLDLIMNFSVKILSSKNDKELKERISDSVKEIYQSSYVLFYEKIEKERNFILTYITSIADHNFPKQISFPEKVNSGKLNISFSHIYEKCFIINPEEDKEIILICGTPNIENFLLADISKILDSVIPIEIERAFRNVYSFKLIQSQKEYLDKIIEEMDYFSNNLLDFEHSRSKEELLSQIRALTKGGYNFSINSLELYESGSNTKEESKTENILEFNSKAAYLGKVNFTLKTVLDKKENYLLNFLSRSALLSLEKLLIINSERDIISYKDIITPFLNSKYRLAGFPSKPNIYIIPSTYKKETLEGLGVGLEFEENLFFATFLSEQDIIKLLEDL